MQSRRPISNRSNSRSAGPSSDRRSAGGNPLGRGADCAQNRSGLTAEEDEGNDRRSQSLGETVPSRSPTHAAGGSAGRLRLVCCRFASAFAVPWSFVGVVPADEDGEVVPVVVGAGLQVIFPADELKT